MMAKPPVRQGAALITVLVLLALITITLLMCAQQTMLLFRQQRREADARQAQWLAEAAVQRGLLASAKIATYRGETWEVTIPVSSTAKETGQVEIRVERAEATAPVRLLVTAHFPKDPLRGVRHEIEYIYPPQKATMP